MDNFETISESTRLRRFVQRPRYDAALIAAATGDGSPLASFIVDAIYDLAKRRVSLARANRRTL